MSIKVKPLTAGTVTSTGIATMDGEIFGGFALTADGTNAATITIRDTNVSGQILVTLSSTSSIVVHAPYERITSKTVYYDVSGTGGAAMLFEWDQQHIR